MHREHAWQILQDLTDRALAGHAGEDVLRLDAPEWPQVPGSLRRKTATVTAEDDRFTVAIDGETIAVVPRTTTREIHRYKAHATQAARNRPNSPARGESL